MAHTATTRAAKALAKGKKTAKTGRRTARGTRTKTRTKETVPGGYEIKNTKTVRALPRRKTRTTTKKSSSGTFWQQHKGTIGINVAGALGGGVLSGVGTYIALGGESKRSMARGRRSRRHRRSRRY